jgi:formamidopyrimidine-DNA glycosylase
MPELPEVETVKNGLLPILKGQKITGAIVRRPNLRLPMPQNLGEATVNSTINDISRRAKYLIFELDNDKVILFHLGMSGKLVWHSQPPESYGKHDHAVINFSHGSLILTDPRRFGLLLLMDKSELNESILIKNLGIEPLEKDFNSQYIINGLKKRSQNIKIAIMDGHFVVGVGNIYASESLFRAKILPSRPANTLKQHEAEKLADSIKNVLNDAIRSGGSTLRDYVRSDGNSGYFQHSFKVYGREGQACISCGNKIKRAVMGQRATYWCQDCQK